MIYLHKLLPLLTAPLFVSLMLLLIGIYWKKRIIFYFVFFILFACSNPIISDYLIEFSEKPYKPIRIESLERADFVIVLSGDEKRFAYATKIFKSGKAGKILVTGGRVPWEKKNLTDGEYYKTQANKYGVEVSDIISTGEVQNTQQEATAISNLLPKRSSVIIVTSASHMHRAMLLFDKYDFEVRPFPINFFKKQKMTVLKFVPSAMALHRTSGVYRELQGRLYYKLRQRYFDI